MGTLTNKIGNVFNLLRDLYVRLGEYDVNEVNIDDFASLGSTISPQDYAYLKGALSEVNKMEKAYARGISGSKRKASLSHVSKSGHVNGRETSKPKVYFYEKERED